MDQQEQTNFWALQFSANDYNQWGAYTVMVTQHRPAKEEIANVLGVPLNHRVVKQLAERGLADRWDEADYYLIKYEYGADIS